MVVLAVLVTVETVARKFFGLSLQGVDELAVVALAAFALLLAWTGWLTLDETIEFRSTAPTPWATPLLWPQSAWLFGLLLFAAACLVALLDASRLFFFGNSRELARRYGPRAVEEEMDEELADLRGR